MTLANVQCWSAVAEPHSRLREDSCQNDIVKSAMLLGKVDAMNIYEAALRTQAAWHT